jgi:hypothetical protein
MVLNCAIYDMPAYFDNGAEVFSVLGWRSDPVIWVHAGSTSKDSRATQQMSTIKYLASAFPSTCIMGANGNPLTKKQQSMAFAAKLDGLDVQPHRSSTQMSINQRFLTSISSGSIQLMRSTNSPRRRKSSGTTPNSQKSWQHIERRDAASCCHRVLLGFMFHIPATPTYSENPWAELTGCPSPRSTRPLMHAIQQLSPARRRSLFRGSTQICP